MLVGLILIVLTGAFFMMDAALSGLAEMTGLDLFYIIYDSPLYVLVSSGMSVLFEVGLIVFAVAAYLTLRDLKHRVAVPEEAAS